MHLGPHILLEAGGRLLDPAELLRRLRRQQGLCPSARKARRWCSWALRWWQRKAHGQTRLGVARWRLRPGPRARAREAPCKIARCAANMAADGRKVLGRDGAASPGDQGGAWQSQGRNLTALRPAGGAGSRENLLRTMPWYPCNSIDTAIREISPCAFQQCILHSIGLLWPYLRACGTFSDI